jgi:hypothetical protein
MHISLILVREVFFGGSSRAYLTYLGPKGFIVVVLYMHISLILVREVFLGGFSSQAYPNLFETKRFCCCCFIYAHLGYLSTLWHFQKLCLLCCGPLSSLTEIID